MLPTFSSKTKTHINKILQCNKKKELAKRLQQVGKCIIRHLHGLLKIYKKAKDPPLRPIILMCSTVTHYITQHNILIRLFINKTYIIQSSEDLLLKLISTKLKYIDCLAKLDVKSLFTNVSVEETTNIIIKKVYYYQSPIPSPLPKEILRKLLIACCTQTPFNFNGKTYLQVDGISIGILPGPTYVDMAFIGNKLIPENNFFFNPEFYTRYVAKTLTIFKDPSHISFNHQTSTRNKCVAFHLQKNKASFNFLNVKLSIDFNENMQTSID